MKDFINLKLLWFTLNPNDLDETENKDDKSNGLVSHGKISLDNVSKTEVKKNVSADQQKNALTKEYNYEFNDIKKTKKIFHDVNSGNHKLSLTFGWINEKIHMKTFEFKSEEDKKNWIQAIKRFFFISFLLHFFISFIYFSISFFFFFPN